MTTIALVFPGQANPSYVPLGIAGLAAHIRSNRIHHDAHCHDFNLNTWEFAAAATPGADAAISFFKGETGRFYDEHAYRSALGAFAPLAARVRWLTQLARAYVEGHPLEEELARLLEGQRSELRRSCPDIVGISVLFSSQLPMALALAKYLWETLGEKQRPTVILGGASLSSIDAEGLVDASPYIHAAVLGEGEQVLTALLEGRPEHRLYRGWPASKQFPPLESLDATASRISRISTSTGICPPSRCSRCCFPGAANGAGAGFAPTTFPLDPIGTSPRPGLSPSYRPIAGI